MTDTCGTSVAPAGWYCTRERGHDGPCAAHPMSAPHPEPSPTLAERLEDYAEHFAAHRWGEGQPLVQDLRAAAAALREPSQGEGERVPVARTDEPMPQRYVFDLFHSEEDEGYIATIREPTHFGVSGFGETPEEALRQIGEALAACVEDMALPGPEPAAPATPQEPGSISSLSAGREIENTAPQEPKWLNLEESMEGLSVICGQCGALVAGEEAGDRVKWVQCRECATPQETPELREGLLEALQDCNDYNLTFEQAVDRILEVPALAVLLQRGEPVQEEP